jgi:hypothetical protein
MASQWDRSGRRGRQRFIFMLRSVLKKDGPFFDDIRNIPFDLSASWKMINMSITIKLPAKMSVFIVYVPVKVVGNKVAFLKDEYDLIK